MESEGASTTEASTGISEQSQPLYFSVSQTKLLVLSICTLGFYEVYWFYKNWQLVKERERSNIMPVWRAIFAVIFCYALFRRMRNSVRDAGIGYLPAGPLAAGWIIVTILWRLPDPYRLVTFLAVIFLLPVQGAINRLNAQDAPAHNPNCRFSAWNIATVVGGGVLFVLAIIGAILAPE